MASIILYFVNRVSYSDLPPGVKQKIFSYLTTSELLKSVKKLRRVERSLLEDSAIVRENKTFKFKVPRNDNRCLLHNDEMAKLTEKLNRILPLAD